MERIDLFYSAFIEGLPSEAARPEGLSLAVGFFDGVHRGHAEVIRTAVQEAKSRGLTAAAMTFDPHPRVVLGKEQYFTVLTPLDEKMERLRQLGVDTVYVIAFDRDFAAVTAERFVRELLLPLGVRTVAVGFDFTFGHRGEGNADKLRAFGGGKIDVRVVNPVYENGAKVSSTRIRAELAEGRCEEAARLLGRPFEIRGTVVHGDARGRLLGFPTANLALADPYYIPRNGVYAVTVRQITDGAPAVRYWGVLNVGLRPTFESGATVPRLEAHLFDFDGDLYGQELSVAFHAFLRPERKFASVDELVAQIRDDAEHAKRLLQPQKAL